MQKVVAGPGHVEVLDTEGSASSSAAAQAPRLPVVDRGRNWRRRIVEDEREVAPDCLAGGPNGHWQATSDHHTVPGPSTHRPIRCFETLLTGQDEPRLRPGMLVHEAGKTGAERRRQIHDGVCHRSRFERQRAHGRHMLRGRGRSPVGRGDREQSRPIECLRDSTELLLHRLGGGPVGKGVELPEQRRVASRRSVHRESSCRGAACPRHRGRRLVPADSLAEGRCPGPESPGPLVVIRTARTCRR